LRQYPLYSKTSPPPALAEHIKPEDFAKSQKYGQDKAKFALFSKLYSQTLDSALLHYGFYAWCWGASGSLLSKFGYGEEYEVCGSMSLVAMGITLTSNCIDLSEHCILVSSVLPLVYSDFAIEHLLYICSRGEARFQ
jgi:hypothetical protein